MGEFPSEEAPGASVFAKDAAGEVFHTYSSYARGLDILMGTYNILDLVPKGRDEDDLPSPCPGSAIMIAMRKAISQIVPRNTNNRRAPPAARARATRNPPMKPHDRREKAS
jgi:Bacterial protein of unknown function (DUF899)